jgi:hypothetical protein
VAATENIVVEIPPMRYDITAPLLEGRVPLEQGIIKEPIALDRIFAASVLDT